MTKPFLPKVVTANDLLEGDVVYFGADDSWVRDLAQAEVIEDPAIADLRLLEAQTQVDLVVGAYLIDVNITETGPQTTHFREEFRASGPSNYPHGKQAELH